MITEQGTGVLSSVNSRAHHRRLCELNLKDEMMNYFHRNIYELKRL